MELEDKTLRVKAMVERLVRAAVAPKWSLGYGAALAGLQEGLSRLPGLYGIGGLDDERIVDYVVYQVYRSRQAIERGRWSPSWLFSPHSMGKYKNQFMSAEGKSGMNYYIDQWLAENGLSRRALAAIVSGPRENPLRSKVYMESEEPVKRRFLGTEAGMALCQSATSGWSPFSESCRQCGRAAECERVTAERFPELARLRREEYGK